MTDIFQALLLYFALLTGAAALVSGEIIAVDLIFADSSIELVEALP